MATQNLNAELGDELTAAFVAAGFFRRDETSTRYFSTEYNRGTGSLDRYEQLRIEDDALAHVSTSAEPEGSPLGS